MVNDVMMGASQFAVTASQMAGSYAGVSGMVAERGRVTGAPMGLYGEMASSFSRSVTPPNIPVGRHKARGLFDRSTSPRSGTGTPSQGTRRLPQLSLEAHDMEAEFMRRIDRFENELRRCAQQMAVESQRMEVVSRTSEEIKVHVDKISAGLGGYVLKPINDLQTAMEGHHWYMNNACVHGLC